jgi:hypothetical protein
MLFALIFLMLAAFCALMAFQVNKAKKESQMSSYSANDIEMEAIQKPAFDTFEQAAPRLEVAPAPAPVAAPPRQAPPQPQVRPPAPMLKYYFDDGAFERALQKMRGGVRALTIEEIRDFQVVDDTRGTFTIGCPMATFTVDKQNDLKQISQLGTGGRVGISMEDIQRAGMSATTVTVICGRGGNDRAASPARAGSIRACEIYANKASCWSGNL